MKNTLFFLVFFSFFYISANAQSKKNSIELGRSFYYFNKSGFDWDVIFNLKIEYSRKIKDSKWKYRLGTEFFFKEYIIEREIVLGDIIDRGFLIFDVSGYRTLLINKKSELGIYIGALYRLGSENVVKKIIPKTGWSELIVRQISDNAFGLLISSGYKYKFNSTWSLSTELGAHKYFNNDATLFDFFGSLKIGLMF